MKVAHAIIADEPTVLIFWLELPDGGKLRVSIRKDSSGALCYDTVSAGDGTDD